MMKFVKITIVALGLLFASHVQAATTIQSTPVSGLRAYWNFDSKTIDWSSNLLKDASNNGYNATLAFMDQGTNQTAGRVGQALIFDGNFTSGSLASSPLGDFSLPNSICSWAKSTDLSSFSGAFNQTLINILADGNNGVRMGSVVNNGKFFVSYRMGGNYYSAETVSPVLPVNTWQHLCYVWDGANISIYSNGQSIATTTNLDAIGGVNTIGARNDVGDGIWKGMIDEIRVYNRALAAYEIKNIYQSGALVLRSVPGGVTTVATTPTNLLTSGLMGHWSFDGSKINWTTETLVDSSGRGNNGDINNASLSTSPVQGRIGQGFSFDGVNDYIEIADAASLNPANLTISGWFKFNVINGSYQTMVAKWHVGNRQDYVLQVNSNNKIGFWTGDGATGGDVVESVLTPTAGTWYHVVATINGTSKSLYINGVLNNSGTGTAIGDSDVELTLGSKKNGGGTYFEFLNGSVDDIRVYNRALSTSEISKLYIQGK